MKLCFLLANICVWGSLALTEAAFATTPDYNNALRVERGISIQPQAAVHRVQTAPADMRTRIQCRAGKCVSISEKTAVPAPALLSDQDQAVERFPIDKPTPAFAPQADKTILSQDHIHARKGRE